MGLRDISVGSDTANYVINHFLNVRERIRYAYKDIGFIYYNYILSLLGFNPQMYLILYASIVSITVSVFFYKYSTNLLISFILYLTVGLFTFSMSAMRQTLAICFIIQSFLLVVKKRYIFALMLLIIASSFHLSAVIFIPFFIIGVFYLNHLEKKGIENKFEENHSKKILIFYYFSIFSIILSDFIVSKLINYLPEAYKYILTHAEENHLNWIFYFLQIGLSFVSVALIRNRSLVPNENGNVYILLGYAACISIFISGLAMRINIIMRFTEYFSMSFLILIPLGINSIKEAKIKPIVIIICLFIAIVAFSISTPGGVLEIDNYKLLR